MTNQSRADTTARNLVSLAEAASRFGVSTKTLRRRISDGTIHGYKAGRLVRVDLDELDQRLIVEMPTTR
ncbi:helix-turn-helix domain-containing protein [Kocuria sp. KD4]|uniref:helix-turn-helix domain-containing protein n=1 Tax=Kocuria sp. KD4 TaxID=2719588 RepID=UPI0014277361|nr:helix-turn-helix domain-containing protein [Kocuria sp. KD4]QIR69888.1 helix-turn-helix domain-containing protein [Kocuria sp. KD4]